MIQRVPRLPVVPLRFVALAGAIVFALAACGGGGESGTPASLASSDTSAGATGGLADTSAGRSEIHLEKPLRIGSTGTTVAALQRALKELGFDAGPPDGQFGKQTRTAVKAFQKKTGLPVTGVVNRKTIRALNRALAGLGN